MTCEAAPRREGRTFASEATGGANAHHEVRGAESCDGRVGGDGGGGRGDIVAYRCALKSFSYTPVYISFMNRHLQNKQGA